MSLPGPRFTYEDYKLLPEDKRCEIIEGDLLMTPTPTSRHQVILGEIFVHLRAFVKAQGLGLVLLAPTDVVLSEGNVVQPDLLFVAKDRHSIVDPAGGVHGAPDLVVEILSPSTSSRDQVLKRKLYAKYGVREYWVVNAEARTIEVLTRDPGGLETWMVFPSGSSLASQLLPGFSLSVAELFAD